MSLSKNINPSLELVQPRKTGPFITERLLMGHKESNLTAPLIFRVKMVVNTHCCQLEVTFFNLFLKTC